MVNLAITATFWSNWCIYAIFREKQSQIIPPKVHIGNSYLIEGVIFFFLLMTLVPSLG